MTAPIVEANLLNDLTNNFQQWHQTTLEDGTTIHARSFTGRMHERLKNTFDHSFNSFTIDRSKVVVTSFRNYTNITVFELSDRYN